MTAQVAVRRTERYQEQPRDGWRSLSEQDAKQGVMWGKDWHKTFEQITSSRETK